MSDDQMEQIERTDDDAARDQVEAHQMEQIERAEGADEAAAAADVEAHQMDQVEQMDQIERHDP